MLSLPCLHTFGMPSLFPMNNIFSSVTIIPGKRCTIHMYIHKMLNSACLGVGFLRFVPMEIFIPTLLFSCEIVNFQKKIFLHGDKLNLCGSLWYMLEHGIRLCTCMVHTMPMQIQVKQQLPLFQFVLVVFWRRWAQIVMHKCNNPCLLKGICDNITIPVDYVDWKGLAKWINMHSLHQLHILSPLSYVHVSRLMYWVLVYLGCHLWSLMTKMRLCCRQLVTSVRK